MGRIARFFGFEEEKPNATKDYQENAAPAISDEAVFVTSDEAFDYSMGIMGQLLSQESQLEFISTYLPENGRNLMDQAESIKKLLLISNDDQDPVVVQAFEKYIEMFHTDYRRADGLSSISQLDDINDHLNKLFRQSVSESHLDKDTILSYIGAIKALQTKVDEAEATGKPILTGPSKQFFTDKSLESEYRLKMLELLYVISQNTSVMYGDKSTISNPFKKLNSAQKSKFPTLFRRDLKDLAGDYNSLSYSEDVLNNYSRFKFSSIDKYADQLNIKVGTQALRDCSYRKMFDGELAPEELFENIKKLVYMRYTLNEMQYDLPEARKRKEDKAQRDKEEKEAAERKRQEEAKKKAAKEAEEKRLKEEAEEAERLAKEKAEKDIQAIADAEDGDIQAMIDNIFLDVTQTGSRFVNIIDTEKSIAKIKGLLPKDDMVQSDKLVFHVFDASEIIKFIKHANDSGVNYMVFPDSQECANGGFAVLVSRSDDKVFNIPDTPIIFGNSSRSYANGENITKWKSYGTVPGYYLAKIQELFEESDDERKEEYKSYIYVDKTKKSGVYELGLMKNYYEPSGSLDKFLTKLVKKADKQLKKQWQDRQEDKDILSYVSVPASRSVIPLLRTCKEKGVTPYFERVPLKSGRNTDNRDDIHIYFYRSDFDKFWNEVRPTLINVPEDQRIPFEVHYGRDYDFVAENATGLNLKVLNEKGNSEHEY